MNEVVKDQTSTAIAKPQISQGGAVSGLIPKDLDQAYRYAQALSRGGEMVPQHFQGKPDAIMAAIARGLEIGLAPMQALSNIAVINGRASLWGDALPAIIQKHGHHVDVVLEGEGDELCAIATLTRGDTGKSITRTFSMMDAKIAGLAGKKGPWQTYPKRMLQMRARSWAIRDGAADCLMGLQVAEEVSDYEPIKDVTPKESQSGFARMALEARKAAETPPEPDVEPEGVADAEISTEPASEQDTQPDDASDADPIADYAAGAEWFQENGDVLPEDLSLWENEDFKSGFEDARRAANAE